MYILGESLWNVWAPFSLYIFVFNAGSGKSTRYSSPIRRAPWCKHVSNPRLTKPHFLCFFIRDFQFYPSSKMSCSRFYEMVTEQIFHAFVSVRFCWKSLVLVRWPADESIILGGKGYALPPFWRASEQAEMVPHKWPILMRWHSQQSRWLTMIRP